jgi:galactokinase
MVGRTERCFNREPPVESAVVTSVGNAICTVWAPGRVNLIGEHTDYSGGFVLPAAIQYGVTAEVQSTADNVSLNSDGYGEATAFAADGSGDAVTGWARYAQAVAVELAELGRPPVGLTATLHSDLPSGAGLSSSAALEVAVALALCTVADFDVEPLELAKACRRAELRAVGVPCGILDQAACLLGEDGEALLLDCGTLAHRLVSIPAEAELVVIDSGVSHSHETSGYADRRREVEYGMDRLGAEHSTELLMEDAFRLDPLHSRRMKHVVSENVRVLELVAAVEKGDLERAGRLLFESHASLRDDFEVSVPEIDILVELARDAGAFGARLVGGGFGGSILALTDVDGAAGLVAAVTQGYKERTGRRATSLLARPSAGASVRRR